MREGSYQSGGKTIQFTDADTVQLATELYQYVEHDYKGSPSVDAVRLESIVKNLQAGMPLQSAEWDILRDLRNRLGAGFDQWRQGDRDGQGTTVPAGSGRVSESAEPARPPAPLALDRLITHAHLLDSALHDGAHAALHTERLADPKVQRDPKAVKFHYDHIIKHVIGFQDHAKRLRDHLSEHPSDPKVFKAEQPLIKQQRESTPSPPPNLREAPLHDEASENSRQNPVHECGTCKMFNDGRCWGYGNIRVGEDWVCDSWTIAPDWRQQNAAADGLDLVRLAEAGKLIKDDVSTRHALTIASTEVHQPTVCVDFDGTLHIGPHGLPGHVNGELMDGAKEALQKIHDMGYRIIVLTARVDLEAVRDWLKKQGLGKLVAEVTNRKPPASAYIDDRATHFTGWENAVQAVNPLVAVQEEPETFREADPGTLAALSRII